MLTRPRLIVALAMALLLMTGLLGGVASAAVTFGSSSAGMTTPAVGTASTSLSIPRPGDLAVGDLMLAQITFRAGDSLAVTHRQAGRWYAAPTREPTSARRCSGRSPAPPTLQRRRSPSASAQTSSRQEGSCGTAGWTG